MPCDARHEWTFLFGAACPARVVAAGLVLSAVDIAAMRARLAEASCNVAPLDIPDTLFLLTLPPYSPELNPVGSVRQYLRANWRANSVLDTCEAILNACCSAWNLVADDPETHIAHHRAIRGTGQRIGPLA